MKSHLLFAPEPLTFGESSAHCLCGATVAKARPVMMQEISERGLPELNSLRDCSDCIKRAEAEAYDIKGKRYLYAVAPGQEAREDQ